MAIRVDLQITHLEDEKWKADFVESVTGGNRTNYFRINAVTVSVSPSTPTQIQLPHSTVPRLVFMKHIGPPNSVGIAISKDVNVAQPFALLGDGEFALFPTVGSQAPPVFYAKAQGTVDEPLLVVIWDGWAA